ncbi:MAG: MFS transporter, partial [Oscillospiraceae bacterium]|nr:MFS transporter [Oscillospiraceae bacterium]
ESYGWRAGFRAEAVAALVLYAPLLVLPFAYRPEDRGLAPLGGERKTAAQAPAGGESQAADRPRLLFAALLLMTAFANMVSTFPNHLPGVADSYALSAAVGAAMLSASMIANALGKVAMGALAEHFGVKRPALAYAAVLALGLGLLLAFRTVPAALAGGAILGLAFSLTTVVPALVTKDVFGAERYRAVFPAVTLAGTVANASAASLIGFLYDAAGSYHPAMLLLIALLGAISLLLLFLYRNRRESY